MESSAGPQPDTPRTSGQLGTAISNALVRIQRDYVGRGPTKARTTVSDNAVLVVLHDNLTKAERSLVDAGEADQVLQIRHSFQRTMRDDMVAAVEQILGRTVIAFMSDNHIDPDLASEIFIWSRPRAPSKTSTSPPRGEPAWITTGSAALPRHNDARRNCSKPTRCGRASIAPR